MSVDRHYVSGKEGNPVMMAANHKRTRMMGISMIETRTMNEIRRTNRTVVEITTRKKNWLLIMVMLNRKA